MIFWSVLAFLVWTARRRERARAFEKELVRESEQARKGYGEREGEREQESAKRAFKGPDPYSIPVCSLLYPFIRLPFLSCFLPPYQLC